MRAYWFTLHETTFHLGSSCLSISSRLTQIRPALADFLGDKQKMGTLS